MSGSGQDDQVLIRRTLAALIEASTTADTCDAAGLADLAMHIRLRCFHAANQSKAIYTRPLSAEERKMIATHLRKLAALIAEAATHLKG